MMKNLYFKTSYGLMAYNYLSNQKSKTLVLLHGWGISKETFESLMEVFKDKYDLLLVDFLGFGHSEEPKKVISVAQYTKTLYEIICYLDLKNICLLGHSFGGRIALEYASKYNLSELILVNSAGLSNRNLCFYLKLFKYKVKKWFYKLFNKEKYKNFVRKTASTDYKNASPKMRLVMKKILKKNQKKILKKIKCKTLIIAGVKDRIISYKDNEILKKKIKNSILIPFYHSGHFCYLDEEKKFIKEVILFLGE